jgi:hypothetical protein
VRNPANSFMAERLCALGRLSSVRGRYTGRSLKAKLTSTEAPFGNCKTPTDVRKTRGV